MSTFTKFDYLLNAMENAAQSGNPSANNYGAKRRAVLDYVAKLEAAQGYVPREVVALLRAVDVDRFRVVIKDVDGRNWFDLRDEVLKRCECEGSEG